MALTLTGPGVLQGTAEKSIPLSPAYAFLDSEIPDGFPMQSWSDQSLRYAEYWRWFRGDYLAISKKSDDGKVLEKYPLRINTIRSIARKHVAALFGEAPDTSTSLVRASIFPRAKLTDAEPDKDEAETLDKKAQVAENAVNEVWEQSHGRAIQYEGGLLAQFLGGTVFKICYEPQRTNLRLPFMIYNHSPEFCLPVFANDNPYNLLECWIAYRIPALVAYHQYGLGKMPSSGTVIYMEHWEPDKISLFINQEPAKVKIGNSYVQYPIKNPFGRVPVFYVPHIREGSNFGSSIVEDLWGLTRELNGRMADMGDAVRETIHRTRHGFNLGQQIVTREIAPGHKVIDLGQESPVMKNPPTVKPEDPINFPPGLDAHTKSLWEYTLRQADLAGVSYGEDEGSQRSGMTLEIRMWPLISHSRAERINWTEAKNVMDRCILEMIEQKMPRALGLPKDFLKEVSITQKWYPQIPRDRMQLVQELATRKGISLLSPQLGMEMLGDVRNPDQELEDIKEWLEFESSLLPQDTGFGAKPSSAGSSQGNSNGNPGSKPEPGKSTKTT